MGIKQPTKIYLPPSSRKGSMSLEETIALGLATVAIGAFNDEPVREVLRLDKQIKPLYIMPVGRPTK